MRILPNLRRRVHKHYLKRAKTDSKPLPKIMPEDAKTVAVIFDATELNNRKIIEDFVQMLKSKGKQVTLLAFFKSTQKPSLPFRYFNKKDVNLLGIPKGFEVERFLAQSYDLLYCLFNTQNLPLEYIGAQTQAHFKVGSYLNGKSSYDVMIDTQRPDIQYFINQIIYYLTKITKKEHEFSTV